MATTVDDMITRIRNEMYAQDITQRDIAKYAGITESSMSRYMNLERKMPFDVVSKCMERLGLEVIVRKKEIEMPPVKEYCMERETWCEHAAFDHYCKFNVCYKELKEK